MESNKKIFRSNSIRTLCTLPLFLLPIAEMNGTTTYAQSVQFSFSLSNSTVKEVLEQIENESEFVFVYYENTFDPSKKVSINANGKEVDEILDEVFAGQGVSYEINDRQVILKKGDVANTASNAVSQQETRKVKGIVKDSSGEPIIGANVLVKGTSIGTITDMDGNFILDVPSDCTLQISYIGFNTQEIKVTNQTNDLTVSLKEDTETLDEVVVVGFGSQKKANLTGSVSTVKMDEVMGSRPLVSASDALQGTMPGLMVSNNGNAPGKGKSFQIRGAYSLGAQNTTDGSYGAVIEPLVLIDNVEGDLDLVNPEDIESITVLKDAASSAIYGARAAGGVILVTTKRPQKNTQFTLNYNNNFAFASAINLPKQTSLETYLRAYSDATGDAFWTKGTPSVSKWLQYLEQYKKDPSSMKVYGDGIYKDADGGIYFLNEKDLVKNMLERSFQQTHNISASGGTDKVRYRLSAGYLSSDGVLITNKDKYTRMNVSGFMSADLTNWFTQEATFSYAHGKKSEPKSALGAIYSTRLASFYPEGTMPEEIVPEVAGLPFFTSRNQIQWSNPMTEKTDNPRIFLKSILKPLKGLQIAFEYTFDKNIYDYHWYTGSEYYTTVQGDKSVTPAEDYLEKRKRSTNYNAINLYATYDLTIKDIHKMKFMAGFNQESSYMDELEAYSYGQAVIEVPSLGGGTSTLKANDSYDEYAVRGGFFRINYSYNDIYLLEVNGRYDGSSKFPKNSRFGFFPSVSAGWNIAQESFMERTRTWLDGLKLRASYGVIGNQNIPTYAFNSTMSINNKYNGWLQNGNYVAAITTLPSLVSQNFTWEKVGTVDVGLDLTMLSNRLTGTFDWYQRNTNGMLAPGMQLPAVVGAEAPYQNTADMRTRGWEVALNWRDMVGNLEYRVGFNLSDSKSIITKYDGNSDYLLSSQRTNIYTGGTYTFWDYYEGKEVGEIWGYEFDGFYTVDDFKNTTTWELKDGIAKPDNANPMPGDVKFKNLRDDEKGTNLITSGDNTLKNPGDRKVIGNEMPRYLYGINLGLGYKGFDLSVFMQGTGRRDKWIANTLTFPLYSDFKFIPLYEGLENYWKPADVANGDYTCVNPDAEYPRIYGSYGNQASNYRESDKYLCDASYFRIKNVTLSYTFPKPVISKLLLRQLKAFVSIENLATFSSLPKGIDPETLTWDYPAFRTVSFGINVTL